MTILGIEDVHLVQAWLADLERIGYRFPQIAQGSLVPE
jgi:hypothetical protein